MIAITVETSDNEPPPLARDLIERLINTTLHGESTIVAAVQVIFLNDDELRELKRRFLSADIYTDVMAFNLNKGDEQLEGEIYISAARALENSRQFNQTHEQELCRLVVHGTLHLMGYDDQTEHDKVIMTGLEDKYLHTVTVNS